MSGDMTKVQNETRTEKEMTTDKPAILRTPFPGSKSCNRQDALYFFAKTETLPSSTQQQETKIHKEKKRQKKRWRRLREKMTTEKII